MVRLLRDKVLRNAVIEGQRQRVTQADLSVRPSRVAVEVVPQGVLGPSQLFDRVDPPEDA